MSTSTRELASTEFSESTEFERCLPPYKEINEADLPAPFVVEDDLHLVNGASAARQDRASDTGAAPGLLKTTPAAVRNEDGTMTPSTVSFTYASADTKCSDSLDLESFSFEGSLGNSAAANNPAKSPSGDPHSAEPAYPCPAFPNVPDLKEDISRAVVTSHSKGHKAMGTSQDENCGVYQGDSGQCSRHAQLASDDFSDYYSKMLNAQKMRPYPMQEAPLCGSCSQSMIKYVSAIQSLIQQLSVDIIVKGKDPPNCSWCAREKLAAFQNAWAPSPFGKAPTVVAKGPDQRGTDPLLPDMRAQTHQGSEAPPQMPASGPLCSPDQQQSQMPGTALCVENVPAHQAHQKNFSPLSQALVPKSPPGQPQDCSEPPSAYTSEPLGAAAISSSGGEPTQCSQGEPSRVHATTSPEGGLSPAALEPCPALAQDSKNDGGTNSHCTESGDLQGLFKQPSELQLYELGSTGLGKPKDSTPGQQAEIARRKSLSSDWMTDLVQPFIPKPAVPTVQDQAYVTMANNDLSAMLCLVLGNSLWLSKTSRSLVILVTDGVSHAFRHLLSCVFNVVLSVRSLGTQGTTKLALLEQPDIGVSFTKLHAWRLTQFSKCVFLDAGMLVVQNCDELFQHDELSAVPDIGWPDCFNSGLFVYVPSMETFWDLISFAERQGSFDGGDQGLLNSYFRNWASDINRKLPFIYNLMANVSYTYKPAFKQFGQNVKVVQFLGGYKPWNVKFHPPTGSLSPAADVHPTYVQFVQFWVQIFVKRVLPLFSMAIQEKTNEQRYLCALDILQHFPSFLIAEPVVCLPAPSLRAHPTPILYLPPGPRVAPEPQSPRSPVAKPGATCTEPGARETEEVPGESGGGVPPKSPALDSHKANVPTEQLPPAVDANCNFLPEASAPHSPVNDFSGMLAWEQGRADYMGEHCSDNIMARLDSLIGPGVQAK